MATAPRMGETNEWREWRDTVAEEARARARTLLPEWLSEGHFEGNTFTVGSLSGQQGRSLRVWLDKGNWKDFGGGEADKGGNLVSLYARVRNIAYRDANEELAQRFGVDKPEIRRSNRLVPIIPVPDFAPLRGDGFPDIQFQLPGELNGWWAYLDADARTLYYRVRLETATGKQFRPLTWCRDSTTGQSRWAMVDHPAPRPLYGLEYLSIMPDAPVLMVEGEKAADAGRMLFSEWCVIGVAGSSISPKNTDLSPLFTRDRVVIWPDNDRPGLKLAAELSGAFKQQPEIVQPEPEWRQGWDLADALEEGWTPERALTYLQEHVVSPAEPPTARPEVDISTQDLETQSQAIWQAVSAHDKAPELVQTDAGLAVVRRELGRASRRVMDIHALRHWLTFRFRLKRYNKEGDLVTVRPDDVLLNNLLRHTMAPMPHVRRVTEVPVFGPDRRLVDVEGLTKSGIYFLPAPHFEHLDIPPLEVAKAIIDDLLSDFPFAEPTDKTHAIAFALTPILRLSIDGRVPLFRFEAPQARTGKTLLMRILSRISCMNIAELGPVTEDDEWRKRITAALRDDPDAILFDNVETLEFPSVKKLLTDDIWQERVLATSTTLKARVQCAFGATVNNPTLSSELIGRSLRVRLDAKSESPGLGRTFRHKHIEEFAARERPMLYAALLAIAQAGEADPNAPTLGGFEQFCRRLYGCLQAAGYEGFMKDREDDSAMDPRESALKQFILAWAEAFETSYKQATDLVYLAEHVGVYLGRSEKDRARAQSLGMTLSKHRGVTFGDWRLCDKPTMDSNGAWWCLIHCKV